MTQIDEQSLVQALSAYVAGLKDVEKQQAQEELSRFILWSGRDRNTQSLTPPEVEDYCGTMEGGREGSAQHIGALKGFLGFLKRQGLTGANLATHAKVRRGGRRSRSTQQARVTPSAVRLTREGLDQLTQDLEALRSDRGRIAQDINRARADKDFRENAPLDAAREQQGLVEARIRELEDVLKRAQLLEPGGDGSKSTERLGVGSQVVLREVEEGREIAYLLVESREANPTAGKLSVSSPVGQAVLNRFVGDEVEVVTPRGSVRYLIASVGPS